MTLENILESIQNWNNVRQSESEANLLALFNNGTGFEFKIPSLTTDDSQPERSIPIPKTYHAYIGLYNGDLFYFLIESTKDTMIQYKSREGIWPYIIVCPLSKDPFPTSVANDKITKLHATELVNNWKNYQRIWIEEQKKSTTGLYQAFVIPFDDIQLNEWYTAYFALNGAEELVYTSDLVLCDNRNPQKILASYFDLVRPIPPFKAAALSKEQFFLLNLALE